MENYKAQMPTIQDEVWAATWAACLKKASVPETSPLWAENDLPSTVAMPEEDFAEEEDSLNEELNAGYPVQSADDVVQEGENVPTPGRKEASGGNNADSTVAEVNTVQATPAPIQDLTLEG